MRLAGQASGSRSTRRLTWAMGVTLVAPLEVRNEQELAELAQLARKLVLRQTTLDEEFPGYVYERQSWLEDQRKETTTFAEECRRQSLLVAQADSVNTNMQQIMDETLADVDGWTE